MARGGKRPNAGRPKGRRNKITAAANATLTEMARAYTPEMLDLLVAVARGEIEGSSGRIHAIEGVLDRGNGKPHQSIDVRALFERRLTELTAEELRLLEDRLSATVGDDGEAG
jgi:hypothetical protein